MDYCLACYWNRVDDNVFETFVKTFRKYNQSALLQVHTDSEPELNGRYKNVEWHLDSNPKGRRALEKLESVYNLVRHLSNGSRVLISDIDVYFLGNPFSAFNDFHFDIGLTIRDYWAPVNGGIWYFQVSDRLRAFFDFSLGPVNSILKPENFPRTSKQWPDWFIDQDYLCWIWNSRKDIRKRYELKILDVGQRYNYCPGTDVYGNLTKGMLQKVCREKSAVTLHLKGVLKECIYEDWLGDAVICHKRGGVDWQRKEQ